MTIDMLRCSMIAAAPGRADLHDHERNTVWVRPAGALEGHSKVNVRHVWLSDSYV